MSQRRGTGDQLATVKLSDERKIVLEILGGFCGKIPDPIFHPIFHPIFEQVLWDRPRQLVVGEIHHLKRGEAFAPPDFKIGWGKIGSKIGWKRTLK